MAEKRYDIQGLRAWAVIAVVIFHFFPSTLRFGYLGVDVFFVLSGFLISLVLENKAIAISTYISFYFKRLRRILPLSLLIVWICSIYAAICYDEILFLYSRKSALHADLFTSNLKGNNEGEDYFRDLANAEDLYTHTWSLSVEVQFYLLAPLLLHIMKPSCSEPIHTIGYFLALAVFSFIYSRSLPSSTAFYSTLARLWQFIVGAIAFSLQKAEKLPVVVESSGLAFCPAIIKRINCLEQILSRLNTVLPSVVAVVLIVWSAVFDGLESTLRCVVTFLAASLLVLKLTTPILTHRSLQIIGDSSYALYLIHWPVVCLLRFYSLDQLMNKLIAMIICFAVSILVYETYEKWYLSLNWKLSFLLIVMLYVASASVYFIYSLTHSEAVVLDDFDRPRTYDEARKINQHMDSQWERYLKLKDCTPRNAGTDKNPWGFCNIPSGNGTLSFLIIGNSYAANHGRMIVDNLKEHYGRIGIHTVSECEPLIETKNFYCKDALRLQQEFLDDIDTFKPDVLFLSARYIEPNIPIEAGKVEDDVLYKTMMEKLKKYE
ncbi:hypothetical protein PENTCL1PPCAC_15964, partial [Pristionchus entomophagus]